MSTPASPLGHPDDHDPRQGLRLYALISRQHWLIQQLVEAQHDMAVVVGKSCPDYAQSLVESAKIHEDTLTGISKVIHDLEAATCSSYDILKDLMQKKTGSADPPR